MNNCRMEMKMRLKYWNCEDEVLSLTFFLNSRASFKTAWLCWSTIRTYKKSLHILRKISVKKLICIIKWHLKILRCQSKGKTLLTNILLFENIFNTLICLKIWTGEYSKIPRWIIFIFTLPPKSKNYKILVLC